MKNKIKYLILIIIAIAIMAIGSVLNAVTYEASGDKNKLTVLKEAYNADKPITQIGKTISISNTNLNSYLTLWCVQQGQSIGTARTYKINTIINIGDYIKEGKAFTKAVSFFKKNGDKQVSDTEFRNARLAYLIEKCKDYSKSDHENYVPQDALWGYFDDWFKKKANLFPDSWSMGNTIKTNDAKRLFANSLIYGKFAAEYDDHGKISVPNAYKEVTVTKKGNYYYAGPIRLNFSYYKETSNDKTTSYASFRTLKEIGALKSIKNGNTNLTVTKSVGGNTVNINTINPNEDFYIRMSNISDEVTVTVTQEEFELVSARLWFLKETNDAAQRLMVSASKRTKIEGDNCKATFKIKTTDVSLQKYITKVNNNDITSNQTNLTSRADTKTSTDETNAGYKDAIRKGVTASNNYKRNNVVKVEVGDTVTYRVYVYNNSTVKSNNIVIEDIIPSYTSIESIYKDSEKTDIKNSWSLLQDTTNRYRYTISSLDGGRNTYFDITLKINQLSTSVLTNSAWIVSTTEYNRKSYRTVDRDYVQMGQYKVSLEKFVSEVTDANGGNKQTYDRSGKRYNESLANGDVNKNVYKYDNRVPLEVGDKVTFTIRLKNTGDNPVKITQIYDSFRFEEAGTVNGLKLVYDSTYGIKGNGDGTITDYHYNDDKDNNNKTLDRYFIQFNNATLLNKNGYVDVSIRYTVEAPAELTASNHSLQNKAGIVQLMNKNNIAVSDSDGTDNNYDMDWVKIKPYKVSLKKYVSKVTDKNGQNEETYDRSATRLNAYAADKTNENNYKTDKKDNPVLLEAGDKVTYTIILKNEGDTPVKISKIYDFFSNKGLEYDGSSIQGNGGGKVTETVSVNPHGKNDANVTRHTIVFDNPVLIPAKGTENVTITFNVISNISDASYCNVARILELKNNNNRFVADSDGTDNNTDEDWVKLKKYKVSLQKIVSSVNDSLTGTNRWESWESNANLNNSPQEETYNQTNLYAKHNNPETVANGDKVTYAIKVTNNHDTLVKNIQIKDTLPDEGLDLNSVKIEKVTDKNGNVISNAYSNYSRNGKVIELTLNTSLNKDESNIIYLSAIVTESNMSTRVLRNYAEIIGTMKNRNDADVLDSTASNNNDADYIQMKDITISGTVWNDMASDKNADNYDGIYNDKQGDKKLSGITVKLYRNGKAIAEKTTDDNGYYSFSNSDIKKEIVTRPCERYIKALYVCEDTTYTGDIECGKVTVEKVENGKVIETKECGANYWKEGNYYSYYVVFEYDGITYTSTIFADVTSDNLNDSNAKEDNSNGMSGLTTRENFNKEFSTINNLSGINYETKNEEGYIPQSRHQYNNTIAIKSSTNLINLSNDDSLETKLQHVNLGLRGRDIFDLELTSNVDTVKVTVNNQQGVYRYSNKVNLRQADLYNEIEDMANPASEKSNIYVDRQEQYLRNSDFNVDTSKYKKEQGISNIEVTYKITVQNASNTIGTASKIINYYDSKYTFVKAYSGNANLDTEPGTSGKGYESRIITTPKDTWLNQSETMDIYVVYTLNLKDGALNGLTKENPIPTYNMAEITEYKTKTIGGEVEYIRGLIDKDSAPGSANVETVRLASGTSDKTTVEYYFAAQNLQNLKYEDDTYATPTLYFVIPYDENRTEDIDGNTIENKYYNRIITGKVFRDETVTDATTKIKTGNGKLDEGEAPVYGATVELIEQVDGGKVRYTTTTGIDGSFRFSGFLPGNYVIRYYYGDTTNTVLLKQNGEVNAYSFNGEDYQATNNSYNLTVKNAQGRQLTTNILEKVEEAENFWYLYNENKGISTAKDDTTRRDKVSKNVIDTAKSDNIIRMLNAARAGENIAVGNIETQNSLIEQTYMFADTDSMLFTVEKTELVESKPKPIERFEAKYIVKDMNFGIAEIPVTTIDLQKEVQSFTITDVTGKNIIAQIEKNSEGKWINKKNVLPMDEVLDVSIEDEKLQGARLQVKYNIIADISVEKNYDGKEEVYATIGGLNDYIDNNLSYNEALGENSKYWEVVKDNNNTQYSTIVKATIDNPILSDGDGNKVATITLEKVLSSTDSTIDEIITSTVDIYEYNNTIKITQIKYNNCPEDKVRDLGRYIILAGEGGQHNGATAQTITIHPPTGDSSISTVYYIIAAISLAVLAAGVFGIKKFVVKK